MTRFTQKEIQAVYRAHPLRKDTILRRLERRAGAGAPLSEADLAEDPLTEITDQNHLGGLAFTRELADRAGVTSRSRVLDMGCGLGGAARALAWMHGCRVHGIDLSPERIRDARELTDLVGLSHLVSYECADALTTEVPADRFEILWGQGAWAHFEDAIGFLDKWHRVLIAGGRVALEDVHLRREPRGAAEQQLIHALVDHWTCHLQTLDGADGWPTAMERNGLSISTLEDHSSELRDHFVALQAAATRSPDPVSSFEQEAWRLAIAAADVGLIGYFRLVVLVPESA